MNKYPHAQWTLRYESDDGVKETPTVRPWLGCPNWIELDAEGYDVQVSGTHNNPVKTLVPKHRVIDITRN